MEKSIKRIFSLVLIIVSALLLVACQPSEPKEITEKVLESLVFEDATYEYDGKEKQLEVVNPYEERGVPDRSNQ